VLDERRFLKASRSWWQNRRGFVVIGRQLRLWPLNLVLFGLPVGLDLLGVLLEIDGEAGVAGGIADEVEIVGLGWMHRGAQGGYAGVGDWARGEAGVFIGVVGRG
jgi:hypothetical protein